MIVLNFKTDRIEIFLKNYAKRIDLISINHKMKDLVSQGFGKVRRYAISKTKKEYVKKQKKERKGNCLRCGNCCKILFNCPFADFLNGKAICKIYDVRFNVCKVFPIDERCLKDVNYQCGFYFENNGHKKI